MNGTHEAHAMFATRPMRLQRVRLLGSANLVQWRALSLSAALQNQNILRRGRWGRVSPGDDDGPFPESWPVIPAGEARFDTGPPGNV